MPDTRSAEDPLAPYDLSHLADGRRTDFPLGMLVETVKVMLNDVYLLEGDDYLLAHKEGQSKVELRRPAQPGDRLIVLRVPSREPPRQPRQKTIDDEVPPYEMLPRAVKSNISREQWVEARREVVMPGQTIPETTRYINLKSGQIAEYSVGERATGPLLPVFDLAGARGKDDTQFHTAPARTHVPPPDVHLPPGGVHAPPPPTHPGR